MPAVDSGPLALGDNGGGGGLAAHLWVESPTSRVESERRGVLALSSLFDTHPPLEQRIAALEESGGFRLPETLPPDRPFAFELGLAEE